MNREVKIHITFYTAELISDIMNQTLYQFNTNEIETEIRLGCS